VRDEYVVAGGDVAKRYDETLVRSVVLRTYKDGSVLTREGDKYEVRSWPDGRFSVRVLIGENDIVAEAVVRLVIFTYVSLWVYGLFIK
tara:strand:- start:578 stop:841 length:264 start_codon:yes stop_codon:yes gene_type:complete